MRCLKKTESQCRFRADTARRMAAMAVAVLLCFPAQAAEIVVRHASTKLTENRYHLNARIEFILDDDIRNAVEHGVQLNIETTVEIRRERNWLWDPLVKKSRLEFTLENHPLSNNYIVTNLMSGMRHQFATVPEGLKFIGNISNHVLIEAGEISADSAYTGFIKSELNVETLPAPLQPIAYVSGYWSTESAWYEWVVR